MVDLHVLRQDDRVRDVDLPQVGGAFDFPNQLVNELFRVSHRDPAGEEFLGRKKRTSDFCCAIL